MNTALQQHRLNHHEYSLLASFIEQHSGITVDATKQYLVESRLGPVAMHFRASSLPELLCRARSGQSDIASAIVDAVTTNETQWFRDRYPFDCLADRLIPERLGHPDTTFRVWSAATATGQEGYSMAMVILEQFQRYPQLLSRKCSVVATDISGSALHRAVLGHYNQSAMSRGLSSERRNRHFVNRHDQSAVRDEVKALCDFRQLNLHDNFLQLGRFDVVFLRNVLIYFSTRARADVVDRLRHSIKPGGYLVLGAAEDLPYQVRGYRRIRFGRTLVFERKSS